MRSVTTTEARRRFSMLLHEVQNGPVVIRRKGRDVGVIVSVKEYERIRGLNAAEFQRFCDRVGRKAKTRGMNDKTLKNLRRD